MYVTKKLWSEARLRIQRLRPAQAKAGHWPEEAELIAHLAVDPDARFSNVGFDLMLDMEEQARRRGKRRVYGVVDHQNTSAIRLYEAIGFRQTSPGKPKGRYFAMHKNLNAVVS